MHPAGSARVDTLPPKHDDSPLTIMLRTIPAACIVEFPICIIIIAYISKTSTSEAVQDAVLSPIIILEERRGGGGVGGGFRCSGTTPTWERQPTHTQSEKSREPPGHYLRQAILRRWMEPAGPNATPRAVTGSTGRWAAHVWLDNVIVMLFRSGCDAQPPRTSVSCTRCL